MVYASNLSLSASTSYVPAVLPAVALTPPKLSSPCITPVPLTPFTVTVILVDPPHLFVLLIVKTSLSVYPVPPSNKLTVADPFAATTTLTFTPEPVPQVNVNWIDPLAQTFRVSAPSGMFVTKIQTYFKSKDATVPVRLELQALSEKDFINILTETENSLTKQYSALMQTEGITLKFEDSGIKALAKIAAEVNASIENIGARRLYTILEKVFENLSYSAPDQKEKKITINKEFVNTNLEKFAKSSDISRYVL